jgi:hypothetical protein
MESQTSREMPRYKCHKEVHALRIKALDYPKLETNQESDGSLLIIPWEEGYAPFRVDYAYVSKHHPKPGGYFVVYEDGYTSFSPAEAFESGYTLIT